MLLGENGAGKSTLVNILIGATEPSKGSLLINGQVPARYDPSEARRCGINAVLQDFSLAPALLGDGQLLSWTGNCSKRAFMPQSNGGHCTGCSR